MSNLTAPVPGCSPPTTSGRVHTLRPDRRSASQISQARCRIWLLSAGWLPKKNSRHDTSMHLADAVDLSRVPHDDDRPASTTTTMIELLLNALTRRINETILPTFFIWVGRRVATIRRRKQEPETRAVKRNASESGVGDSMVVLHRVHLIFSLSFQVLRCV